MRSPSIEKKKGERMKIVVDTNVLISAFISKGPAKLVLDSIDQESIFGIISVLMLEEFEEVIKREKFGWDLEHQNSILAITRDLFLIVPDDRILPVVFNDPDDDVVLACAACAYADIIVSGDKHLLSLKEYRGVRILTPREFIEYVLTT